MSDPTFPPGGYPTLGQLRQNYKDAKAHQGALFYFYFHVRNHGPWDYKQIKGTGTWFGNYNYGYTARGLGLSENFARRAAGLAQWFSGTWRPKFGIPFIQGPYYGDDPADQHAISGGYNDAKIIEE